MRQTAQPPTRQIPIAKAPPKLSLYVNGKYFETHAHYYPYLKEAIVMVPLIAVAAELGYRTEYDAAEGFVQVFRTDLFDENLFALRFVKEHEAVTTYYYTKKGEFFELSPPEVTDSDVFIPLEAVEKALGCAVAYSDKTGNINIRG